MAQWLQFVVCLQLLNRRDVRYQTVRALRVHARHRSRVVQWGKHRARLRVFGQHPLRAQGYQVRAWVVIRVSASSSAASRVLVMEPLALTLAVESWRWNRLPAICIDISSVCLDSARFGHIRRSSFVGSGILKCLVLGHVAAITLRVVLLISTHIALYVFGINY